MNSYMAGATEGATVDKLKKIGISAVEKLVEVKKDQDRLDEYRSKAESMKAKTSDSVYRRVLEYVTDDDPPAKAYSREPWRFAQQFPTGCGSDQAILRYLEPEHYPRLRVDAERRFAAKTPECPV